MLRVALALGLLITPAAAEEYTQQDCETLDIMLNNCSDKPECNPVRSGYEARRFGALLGKHPSFIAEFDLPPDERPFNKLCRSVCDGKLTPLDAVEKFCPGWRPEL